MSNQQRGGVYQPIGQPLGHSLGDTVPLYDIDDEDVEDERSRLPLLIVIALVILAAFAGVVWVAYNQGVARGRASVTAVVDAPNGPVKTAPDDADANASPYAGLKVYSQGVPPDQEAQASTLAKSAEPVETPTSSIQTAPPVQTAPPPPQAAQVNPPPSTEAPPARLSPPPSPPAAVKPVAPASVPAALAAQSAASVAAAKPAAVVGTGTMLLQIGSYESMDIANGAWATFKAKYADVAGSLSPDIQKVDLGAKGTWYRLRVGAFDDKTKANAACEKLKAEGATCFITAP